jgi:hypothetical protein
MSGPIGSSQWMYSSGAAGFFSYSIDQSLRMNKADSPRLIDSSVSSDGNRKKFTFSFWIKLSKASDTYDIVIGAGGSGSYPSAIIGFHSQRLTYKDYRHPSYTSNVITTAVFRDASSFYHFVVAVDTTQSTASDRVKMYVNGTQLTDFDTASYPTQNYDTLFQDATSGNEPLIGFSPGFDYMDGYLADIYNVDNAQLAPTEFGETKNGVWIPKEYSGSFGTTGYHLTFSDSSSIGADSSGNSHSFDTVTNLAASDVVSDSPTDNHATWSPIHASTSGGPVFSEGNTRFQSSGASWSYSVATMAMPNNSGKYAWKFQYNAATNGNSYPMFFITSANDSANFGTDVTPHKSNGNSLYISVTGAGTADSEIVKNVAGTDTSIVQYTHGGLNGATFEILLDTDANTITIKDKDGTARVTDYDVSYIDDGSGFIPVVQAYSYNNAELVVDYTPSDSNYKLLKSSSLPEPTIGPNAAEQADDYFNTVLYTGTGATQSITVGFQPDWVFVKRRAGTQEPSVTDSVRGVNAQLRPASTAAESAQTDALTSFDANGFTLGADATNRSYNYYTDAHVAWNWKAGGTAVSNSNGSITSSVSAAPDAGFSIVSWTGTGANATVGHGLSKAELIIIKRRDNGSGATSWKTGSEYLSGWTHRVKLNSTDAEASEADVFNDTAPTSTVFSLGSDVTVNGSSGTLIAYCFHSVDGYSKVGRYVGNGSSDGVFVYTNFSVKFLLIKRVDSTSHWALIDSTRSPYNVSNAWLAANLANDESSLSNNPYDLLSNGFKARDTLYNVSGGTYIYLAFGSSFKYSNAR